MLFFWISGVLGFVRYARTDSRRALWWGAAAGALATVSADNAFTRGHDFSAASYRIGALIELKDIILKVV